MSKIQLNSPDKKHCVTINQGELNSYTYNSEEIIHQKGNPGWRNSDTEMFPLIGATSPNNFKVSTPRGECIQDQHGLLRELEYSAKNINTASISYHKTYRKNAEIKNSKYPDKSPEPLVYWPYDFEFIKHLKLSNDGLTIRFEIIAEKGMPFMLGYHPAFLLDGDKKETLKTTDKSISIDDVLSVGASAYPVLNTSEITLERTTGLNVKINLEGFGNFMLWTEVNNMLCIEPISFYPNATEACLSKEMFRISNGEEHFKVIITPNKISH